MGRKNLNFNTDWLFTEGDIPGAQNSNFNDSDFKKITLPHTNKIVPHHYFSEEDYRFISWYRRHFYLQESYQGNRIVVRFEGVMSLAVVYVNSHYVGEHRGGYTSFSYDITDFVRPGEENIIAVRVDSRERQDIPPEGGLVDYMLFGGIYREAGMLILSPVHIENPFYKISEVGPERAVIKPELVLKNHYKKTKEIRVITSIRDKNGRLAGKSETELEIGPGKNEITQNEIKIDRPHLWYPETPYLYQIETEINICDDEGDKYSTKIGLRKFEFDRNGKFQINDRPLKLRGLNRHQMFPFIGNAMPARGQRKDAEILKKELGLNFVRSSHYPAHPEFLKRCDELGLLVAEEIPGWQHIGDKEWKETLKENLREMILRDRNHASIFLWGVRVNESPDDNELYRATNKIARELDSTRPTFGVRNFRNSEFLEDVFTYNDFEHNLEGKIKTPHKKPYMITEYMGHMYPTKSYDSVERLIKHAVKHAKIQDCQYGIPGIAGASGWCAFDYNTHADFGSGDRVCYHGVCDMYRLPKFAAYFYKSQKSPAREEVVFIARYLTPSFNEDYGEQIIVFSNCELVNLYIDDEKVGSVKPDRNNYPALPHPPFVFKGCRWWEWGASTINSIRATGLIKGRAVAEHIIYPFGRPQKIVLKADQERLRADGGDLTRVIVKLKDKNDQTLHLAHQPVFFDLQGPARLIGENPFSLEAGRGAVFVQSTSVPGKIVLKAEIKGLPVTTISLQSEKLKEKVVPLRAK